MRGPHPLSSHPPASVQKAVLGDVQNCILHRIGSCLLPMFLVTGFVAQVSTRSIPSEFNEQEVLFFFDCASRYTSSVQLFVEEQDSRSCNRSFWTCLSKL